MKTRFKSVQEAAEHILLEIDDGFEAWAYLHKHAPGLKEALQQKMRELFPELRPVCYDDDGNAYFDLSSVAKAMDVGEEEILASVPEDIQIHTNLNHSVH